jgi:hypothetical protein
VGEGFIVVVGVVVVGSIGKVIIVLVLILDVFEGPD